MIQRIIIGSALGFAVLGITVPACAPKGLTNNQQGVLETQCVLPSSERNTLQGRWSGLPIKASFHTGDWSSSEMNAVTAGANTWNSFYGQVHSGTSPINLSPSNASSLQQSAPSCGATIPDGAVLYKRYGGWNKASTAVAVTTSCFPSVPPGGGLATIVNAIMEFNYTNFFVQSSGRFPDLQSIATHELGHLLGLDHPCGPLGKPNQLLPFTNCPDPSSGDPLLGTVMFPTVFFDGSGNGQIKQSLADDDEGRANCLYQGS